MALPPNNNYLYGNVNLPYENNNQMAFRPGSMKDRALKQLDVMPDMDQKRYDNLRKEDVDQFNEKGIPLSLPKDRYKDIEGYTANAAGYYPGATMTDANSYITRKTPTDTFQSMFQNVDTGRYNTNQNDFSYNTNNIGSSRGGGQNYGITSATQNQTPYNYDDVDKFTNDEQGPIVDQEMQEYYNTLPEEEKEGFGKFLSNAGVNIGNFAKDAAGRTIASQALGAAGGMFNPYLGLAGMMFGGFKGGNMFGPSQSSKAYDSLNSQGRSTVDNIYGSGGIMSGYNPVSAFGRGPIGAIDNRMENISNRTAPQTAASQQRLNDLYTARSNIMQTTLDDDAKKKGPTSSVRGQKKGVMDDDPFATTISKTSDGDAGGSSKIICTMMNDSYGFGNFRNKIWLKHSKDLPKEYEVGYHKIFLPLVKFAKGRGKINKVVKKTLEHIARHRTLDLKQEMKGKTHLLGRIYRKILEPICFIAGMYR